MPAIEAGPYTLEVRVTTSLGVDLLEAPVTIAHATTLSLATDNLLAERVAVEAAEPLGIPVFPVMPYGITPVFRAYPGSISASSRP